MGLINTGAGGANRAATQAVQARQGSAQNLTSLISNTFNDPRREARTTDFMGALRTQLADATNRGFADASRHSKFATARAGLTGGRVDIDRQTRGFEGLMQRRIGDEARVQDAGNQIRQDDRATQQSLIGSAYGAADIGQSGLRSLLQQRVKNAGYLRTLMPQAVGNAGGAWADLYGKNAEADEFGRGVAGG